MGSPRAGHSIEIISRLLPITNIMIMLIPDTVEIVVILLIRDGDKGEKNACTCSVQIQLLFGYCGMTSSHV